MATKSAQNKIKQYSGVAKTVKDKTVKNEEKNKTNQTQQKIEEPKITHEQVVNIFKSFGFEPNSENNDIGYWTSRGQSESTKLVEELYNKRKELNSQKEVEGQTKKTLPRLSDEDILSLYDEYGLPTPDPEWVRNHMPNDTVKLRSLLETQRKITDDSIKSKFDAKKQMNNTMMGQNQVPSGMGGPVQLPPTVGEQNINNGKTTPFFIGDHSLVKITNPSNPNASTIWLVDAKKKVLRPFLSQKAFENAFENPQEAENAVVTVSSTALGPGGVLEGFTPLKGQKGVKEDGSMDNIEFSPAQIQRRYGKKQDENAENKALSMLDGVFSKLMK